MLGDFEKDRLLKSIHYWKERWGEERDARTTALDDRGLLLEKCSDYKEQVDSLVQALEPLLHIALLGESALMTKEYDNARRTLDSVKEHREMRGH